MNKGKVPLPLDLTIFPAANGEVWAKQQARNRDGSWPAGWYAIRDSNPELAEIGRVVSGTFVGQTALGV
jgi:hypothetical protein